MRKQLRNIWSLLLEAYRRFENHGCPTMSAAVSFYTLLSLIPLALLAISIFGHFMGAEEARRKIAELVHEVAPGSSDALLGAIRVIAARQGRRFVEIVGLLGLLWSGMNLVGSLSLFLTRALTGRIGQRTFLREKLVSLVAILVAALLFLLSIVFTGVVSSVSRNSEVTRYLQEFNVPLSWFAFFIASVAMFFLLYRCLPAAAISTRAALIGAVPGAALWHITRKVFSILVANSTRYGQIYGPLAGVVIFMVWIFYTAMILFFCAEIAAVWQDQQEPRNRRWTQMNTDGGGSKPLPNGRGAAPPQA